ncbi:MAG: hypothetical protein ACYS9X_05530 [Planctomycetota bacterium]|jgi:hypothetical protein
MNGKRNRRTGVGRLAGLAAAALALAGGSGCWCTAGLMQWAGERPARSRALGLEQTGDGQRRVIFKIRDCPGCRDGLYEFEIPQDWRARPRRASEYGSAVAEIEDPVEAVVWLPSAVARSRLRPTPAIGFGAVVRGRRTPYGGDYRVAYVRRGERYRAEVFGHDGDGGAWVRIGGFGIDAGRRSGGRAFAALVALPATLSADFLIGIVTAAEAGSRFFSGGSSGPSRWIDRPPLCRLEGFVRRLSSRFSSERRDALVALRGYGVHATGAVPEVRRLLHDHDDRVRTAARAALATLCPSDPPPEGRAFR